MITIGVMLSNAYADYSMHMIRGLCSRVKEFKNVNLIFFPGISGSDLSGNGGGRQDGNYEDAVSLVDALIISDQEMLQMLLSQPEGSPLYNILEHIPYVLLKDDGGDVLDQACALAERNPAQEETAAALGSKAKKRDDLEHALEFAMRAHKGQVRKGSSVPYIVHPIETALIAMTLTRDQDIIVASLLHDIIEDTHYGAKDIENIFGPRVAHLVQLQSEDKRKGQDAADTWKIRKQEFIDSLGSQAEEEKIIALSDKLSNMRATRGGFLKHGEQFWQRFNQKDKNMHHWYYRTVADKLKEFEDTDAWQELDRLIREVFGE